MNTARGGIHVEQDLYEALVRKSIAGAGIDVFLDEPPQCTHPLLSLDTVIATPHSAGLSREAVRSTGAYASTQWIEIFEGRVPPRLVNPEAWPKYSMRFRTLMGFSPDELP